LVAAISRALLGTRHRSPTLRLRSRALGCHCTFGEIHIYFEAFAGGTYNWSDWAFAGFLVHEAWHAAHPMVSTEDDANAAMTACV